MTYFATNTQTPYLRGAPRRMSLANRTHATLPKKSQRHRSPDEATLPAAQNGNGTQAYFRRRTAADVPSCKKNACLFALSRLPHSPHVCFSKKRSERRAHTDADGGGRGVRLLRNLRYIPLYYIIYALYSAILCSLFILL